LIHHNQRRKLVEKIQEKQQEQKNHVKAIYFPLNLQALNIM
jgi:hypothetical protein